MHSRTTRSTTKILLHARHLGFASHDTAFGKIGTSSAGINGFPKRAFKPALSGSQLLFYPTASVLPTKTKK